MMRSWGWFLLLLILNTLIAVIYLIWYLIFKQDQDNRIQYIMHTIVMIICPLVGPLYFLLGFLKYHFMKLGERDLSDVEFAKKRHVSRVKADEERERNIVPIEEAISISDQEKKRENMLNVLLGETDNSLLSISYALDSDDSEVAHYAASFLQSKMDEFREHVRQAKLSISEKEITEEECQEEIRILIGYMNHMLKQNILTGVEQEDYINQMEELCEQLYENIREKLEITDYSALLQRLLEQKNYEKAEVWGERFMEQYPDELKSYTLRMKLYFETEQKDKFFEVLDKLRASTIVIDNQTLELIRMVER